jgi:hypothetical protein
MNYPTAVRFNPMEITWYARENDLIGGWCIMPIDLPPSSGVPDIGDFLTQEVAQHVADLHNDWLDKQWSS